MAVVKVDISFEFVTKDATQSDREQLKTTKTIEGSDGIPNSTWRVSCAKDETDGKWRLHVDLLEWEAFENQNVMATGKALAKLNDGPLRDGGLLTVSDICDQIDLATIQLKDHLTCGRLWSIESSTRIYSGFRYIVDVNVVLICNKLPLTVSKLQSDFAALFENGKNSDLVLVTEDKEFKVHKIILSGRSEVFERMLETDMKEKEENRVVIEDVKSDVLEKMLLFVYAGTLGENIDQSSSILEDLFTASAKYALTDLKELLAPELCSGITIQNIGRRLVLADQFDEKELRKKCFQFMRDHCDELSERDKSFLF